MQETQEWKNCRYAIGDLDIDMAAVEKNNPEVRLLKAIFPETDEDKLFRKEGVNRRYYCSNNELIALEVYTKRNVPNKKGIYDTPTVQLFDLNISNTPELDWFGQERWHLESMIRDGVAMCTHCKFYEKK